MIRVVCGLLLNQSKQALMGFRGPEKLRPSLWELPGGKVEPGELPEAALIREWKEELNVDIEVGGLLASYACEMEVDTVIDLYVIVNPSGQEPMTLDHVKLEWVEPHTAVTKYPCSPAFYDHYGKIKRWLAFLTAQGVVPTK